MVKADMGVKRRCLTCSTAFFDLKRTPIVCPKCAAVFQVVELPRSSAKYVPGRPPVRFGRPAPAEPASGDEMLLVADDEETEAAEETEEDVEDDAEENVDLA